MKTLLIIVGIIAGANILAFANNLLFSNPITASLAFLSIFATGLWAIIKGITE